ncbi:2'-5' RNA ligase family protein [Nocardia gipuzkoensis]|uniref:2'-5' RNA ligase family protein n=1 Tax=Nocardia gipuzkoensis TaxID=2749991 RepID=UPI003EE361C1
MNSMGSVEVGEGSQSMRHTDDRLGVLGYYWFLTFEQSPELLALVKECQVSISMPHYDLTPPDSLHLTLDRIAYFGEVAPEQLDAVKTAAVLACRDVPPFDISFEHLRSIRGAVVFDVSPAWRVRILQKTLRSATLAAYPEASVKASQSDPHVTIGYPNAETFSEADTAAAVARPNSTVHSADVAVTEAVMVLLERQQHSYSWQVIARIPLGTSQSARALHQ